MDVTHEDTIRDAPQELMLLLPFIFLVQVRSGWRWTAWAREQFVSACPQAPDMHYRRECISYILSA
jgi:hypothetical protein